ncbi:MAG: galactokinase, partial [Actinomycetota bacterium]
MTGESGIRLARAPGRVNLIGDHTDYTGGLVFPMTIDRFTEIRFAETRSAGRRSVHLTSDDEPQPVEIPLDIADPTTVEPSWGRYVAGVVAEMADRPTNSGTAGPHGITGHMHTTIPIGAGLSSSAALEVAAALALGFEGTPLELAQLCQRAENRASGVPSGIMDQLCIAAGVADHALLIDCGALTVTPTPLPPDVEVVVQFIAHRTLVGSAYADRVAECAAAVREIGPLRTATLDDAQSIADPIVRARALHVVSENRRVRDFAAALSADDRRDAGALMLASHASLRDHFDTSTPAMDTAVERIAATRGVHGARMSGGGFGGGVVA